MLHIRRPKRPAEGKRVPSSCGLNVAKNLQAAFIPAKLVTEDGRENHDKEAVGDVRDVRVPRLEPSLYLPKIVSATEIAFVTC